MRGYEYVFLKQSFGFPLLQGQIQEGQPGQLAMAPLKGSDHYLALPKQ